MKIGESKWNLTSITKITAMEHIDGHIPRLKVGKKTLYVFPEQNRFRCNLNYPGQKSLKVHTYSIQLREHNNRVLWVELSFYRPRWYSSSPFVLFNVSCDLGYKVPSGIYSFKSQIHTNLYVESDINKVEDRHWVHYIKFFVGCDISIDELTLSPFVLPKQGFIIISNSQTLY